MRLPTTRGCAEPRSEIFRKIKLSVFLRSWFLCVQLAQTKKTDVSAFSKFWPDPPFFAQKRRKFHPSFQVWAIFARNSSFTPLQVIVDPKKSFCMTDIAKQSIFTHNLRWAEIFWPPLCRKYARKFLAIDKKLSKIHKLSQLFTCVLLWHPPRAQFF